jgi:hypothetical protein
MVLVWINMLPAATTTASHAKRTRWRSPIGRGFQQLKHVSAHVVGTLSINGDADPLTREDIADEHDLPIAPTRQAVATGYQTLNRQLLGIRHTPVSLISLDPLLVAKVVHLGQLDTR